MVYTRIRHQGSDISYWLFEIDQPIFAKAITYPQLNKSENNNETDCTIDSVS